MLFAIPLLVVLTLIWVLHLALGSSFSFRRATHDAHRSGSPSSMLVLSLVSVAQFTVERADDLAISGPVPRGSGALLAALALACTLGLLVARRFTEALLGVLGLVAGVATLARDHGPATALGVAALGATLVWLAGAWRGVTR